MTRVESPLCPDRLHGIMTAYLQSKAVFAALQIGLFEELHKGPCTVTGLASALGLERRPTEALLHPLHRMKLVQQQGDKIENAPEAEAFLVSDSSNYMGGFAEHQDRHFAAFTKLHEALRENTSVTRRVLNDGYRDQGAAEGEGREGTARLIEAMRVSSRMQAPALAAALPEDMSSLADIGCGSGDYSIAVASHHSDVSVICADYPNVCEIVEKNVATAGLASRVSVLPVDIMNDPLPAARDYLLSHVLDGYGTERSRRLISKIYHALEPGGRLFIHGHMPSLATGPFPSLFGLILLVNTETGEVHDVPEIRGWLEEAGFSRVDTQSISVLSGLITAFR